MSVFKRYLIQAKLDNNWITFHSMDVKDTAVDYARSCHARPNYRVFDSDANRVIWRNNGDCNG